ncbi:MAG: Nif3-like dinuclear metal center hexameric protein [Clostridia bacterium]|nr:Nif3-like dinuclear metal center hexameric protein [Clostridia bacterium]
MITVKDIFDYLNMLYPVDTACDFDNVGILAGDSKSAVTGAVVALDCDAGTVAFAKEKGANLIITHHPVIFSDGLKTVTENDVVYKLITGGISVISMHTNLDVGVGGINDELCRLIELKNIKPYLAADGYLLKCGKTDISDADRFAAFLKSKLGCAIRYVAGKTPIRSVLVCSGSGGGYIEEAIKGGFDALVTADVKQHQFITAINAGISLFDGGHYNTENIIVAPLCATLRAKYGDLPFFEFYNEKIKTV